MNTNISPNARFLETQSHYHVKPFRYEQRSSQLATDLYAQPNDMCSDDGEDESNQNNSNLPKTSRRKRLRKYLSRVSKTLLLASMLTLVAPRQAEAKFAHEMSDEEKTFSLRPGVSQSQADLINEGEVPDDLPDTPKTFLNQEEPKASDVQKKKTAAKKKAFDYGDEEEDDDLFEDDYLPSKTAPGRTAISKAEAEKSRAFQAGTKSSFSGVAHKSDTEKQLQTLKVGVGAFIPTFGAMFVREFVRRRKEEKYVQKGLEILEAQKAEYFNVTETTADSDIEDELKDLKDEDDEDEDDDDEDDDDDDDEDDDEEDEEDDEPPSRRPPRRPTGGGGSGGGDSSGGDGDGRPSEDDLKRLGDIFNKS